MKTFASSLFALTLAACGGNVVVDESTVTTGSTTTTTTASSSDLDCSTVCEAVAAACPEQGADCASSCGVLNEVGNKLCHDVYQTFLACAIADPEGQCQQTGCSAEVNDFTQCFSEACQNMPSACMF